jgi:hypothetical protein
MTLKTRNMGGIVITFKKGTTLAADVTFYGSEEVEALQAEVERLRADLLNAVDAFADLGATEYEAYFRQALEGHA